MIRATGWRAVVWVLIGLLALAALLAAAVWLATLVLVVGAAAWLNLVVLPRLARRLRLPRLALDVVGLAAILALGWLAGRTAGVAVAAGVWLVGVGLPRAFGWQLRSRLEPAGGHVIEGQACPRCGVIRFDSADRCPNCDALPAHAD